MTKQEQIAAFIENHITWSRVPDGYGLLPYLTPYAHPTEARPSFEQLAPELIALAEFKALRLGTWLGTTDGRVIAQGVEMVTPSLYRQDIELLVAALRYAAELQHQDARRAGRDAVEAIAVGVVGGMLIWALGHGEPNA